MLVQRYYYDDTLTPLLCTDEKEISLLKGTTVQLALSTETYCTGYSRGGEYCPCPKKARGRRQCLSCSQRDDWLACLRCDGSTCLQFNESLKADCFEKEYVVYLASFGQNVKAGVSKKERVLKRWIEQGADFACVIFQEVNGQQARAIETELVRKGLLPRFTLTQKLQAPMPEPQAISEALKNPAVKEVISAYSRYAVTTSIEDLQKFYPMLDDARPTSFLQGCIAGAKGPLLVLDQNGLKMFPLPLAVGKKILEHTLAEYQTLE